jgi:hypothetical protein
MFVGKLKVAWAYAVEKATRCYIYEGKDDNPLAWADAICSDSDQYDKDKGRKISLARVLAKLYPDRNERLPFWQAYQATIGFGETREKRQRSRLEAPVTNLLSPNHPARSRTSVKSKAKKELVKAKAKAKSKKSSKKR